MTTVNPYIYFNGNCEAAFNFYSAVFRTEITYMERYKNAPNAHRHLFKEADEKIMHATLPISTETCLMGADNSAAYNQSIEYSNFSLIINADSKEETDRLFNELAEDGEIKVALNMTFWGAYFGICTDQFGITWKVTSRSEE